VSMIVTSDHRRGGYVSARLILSSGEEVSGMVLTAALNRLERLSPTIYCHRQGDCCGLSRQRVVWLARYSPRKQVSPR
jgi:hypothetical protein